MNFPTLLIAAGLLCISVHTTAQPGPRKKVGVVLSGGGAKGMAHIGALKVIEEAGIPIDYVVGTSMGSIIGGLYSIGYTPEQMDSMVRRQDWSFLLSDKIPRSEQNMAEREASEKYVFSLPFGKNAKTQAVGGLIKGQNLANLFSELTVGYHDSIDFNKLPIPFACVSENIVNGNEVNFHKGVLATAMRASMAIPGVFTPVRLDSMVLVDGGVVNNYPVNVARAMGADIIIGVDVQNDLKPANELNSTGSILGQLINLMGLELYKKNLKETDTYIKVDVEGYSAASFTPSAVDTLIRRGEEAALAQKNSLIKLKQELGLDSTYMPKPLPSYPYSPNRKVYIKEITFDGLDEKDKRWLLKRCDLKEGSNVVYAVRNKREGETFMKKFTAKIYYRMLNSLSDYTFPVDTGDFRLIDRKVLDAFKQFPEKHKYLRGLFSWMGFKQTPFYYTRNERAAGRTKYSIRKMFSLASAGIFGFSKKPLKLAISLGTLSIFIALAFAIWVFIMYLSGKESIVPGWSSTIITIVFLGGVQLFTIGILGEYIGNIFDETKNRPEYIIDKKINFDPHNNQTI